MNILYEIVRKNVRSFMKKNIWTPTRVFNFFTFFERILYKSNCIIFIFSWCATHTKIRSTLVVLVTAGSQKITLWGPQRTHLGILRVKRILLLAGTHKRKPSLYENIKKSATVAWEAKNVIVPWMHIFLKHFFLYIMQTVRIRIINTSVNQCT